MSKEILVNFPFEKVYTCQERMIKSVVHSVFESKNCLIESPTGTGKTMSVLCGVIAAVNELYK